MKTGTACGFNHIYIIQSLKRGGTESDLPTAENLYESSLIELAHKNHLLIDFFDVKDKRSFINKLGIIQNEIALGHVPFVHLDMHGDQKKGLEINPSGEFISWRELKTNCQQINRACNNNLALVLTSCFGFHAITVISIKETSPFFLLIGSEEVVEAGFIDSRFKAFYSSLLQDGNIDKAIQHIQKHYKLYLSETMLVNTFAKYIVAGCKGKNRQERIERLITEFKRGSDSQLMNISESRKILRRFIKPNEASLQRFKNSFLMANHPNNHGRFNVSLDYIMEELHNQEVKGIKS